MLSTLPSIITKQKDGMKIFQLNRPDALNALSLEMIVLLGPQLLVHTLNNYFNNKSCQYADSVNCVVLAKSPDSKGIQNQLNTFNYSILCWR